MMDILLPSAFKRTGQHSIRDTTSTNATHIRSSVTAPAGDGDLERDGRDNKWIGFSSENDKLKKKEEEGLKSKPTRNRLDDELGLSSHVL